VSRSSWSRPFSSAAPRHRGSRRRPLRGLVASIASIAMVIAGALVFAPAAAAAEADVTITPVATSTPSGTKVTYTLTVTCSVTGGCNDTTVSFPSDAITGDGPTTDFGSWVGISSCADVTRTVAAGLVTFDYGSIPTGTKLCTFPVTPPEYTTLNNTQITITPQISGSNFEASGGTPATLTVTAGHNDSIRKSVPAQVPSGLEFSYSVSFLCGENAEYTGDIGLTELTITDQLPSNFDYTGYTLGNGLPGTFNYDPGTHTLTYTDTDGASCGNPPLNISNAIGITITGTASTGGVPNPVGDTICNTVSASFTYLDGTPGTSTSPEACTTVVDSPVPVNFLNKVATSQSLGNVSQYTFPGDGRSYPYTFPGNWNGTGAPAGYNISVSALAANAGVDFAINDPLPCLDNLADGIYSSNTPGTYCANPAFIPTQITASGFTPSASDDEIILHYTDGSTGAVAFTAGQGWLIPASPAVAEIEFPPFESEGANSAKTMTFAIGGYTDPSVAIPSLLTNTATANAYQVGSTTPLADERTRSASLMVVDPAEPSGTVLYPSLTTTARADCTANVTLDNNGFAGVLVNRIEIASAPSQPIYIDYLAPAGGSIDSPYTGAWTLLGQGSGAPTFTSASLTATVTANFNATGRTLYEWVIPAGTITTPGVYQIRPPTASMIMTLPPGCAGTYPSDMTLGYGETVTGCVFNNYSSTHAELPPMEPKDNDDLYFNGSGDENYCGYSKPVNFAAINPGFSLDKTVQGNLDGAPKASGGTGDVSPGGGIATYTLTFTNTGESNLSDPVLYDILPRVGDTRVTSTADRNSQFPVTLSEVGTLPSGVTVSYSVATNPCRPEVLPTNPDCVDDWSTTPPSPLSDTTALKFSYSGTLFVAGATGVHGFTIPLTVSTPSGIAGKTAWNSLGATAKAGDDFIAPAESSLTGLQALTAPTISKATEATGYAAPGDTIDYTFTVTNNTTVALDDVQVTDDLVDAPAGDVAPTVTCLQLTGPDAPCSGASTALQPGQQATFVATFTVGQDDIDAGSIKDTATVTADPPTGAALSSTSELVTVPAVQSPGLSLIKSVTPTTVDHAGQQVEYQFLVHNTGNVTLTDVAIDETDFSGTGTLGTISCPQTTLGPDDQTACTADYTITPEDLPAGAVNNTATAAATAPDDATVTSAPSTATLPITNTFTDGDLTVSTPQNTPITSDLADIVTTSGAPIDPRSVTEDTAPAHGSITVDPATGAVTYHPTPGYSGPDSYAVQVCDTSSPQQCHVSSVSVTVQDNVVTAADDTASTIAVTPVDIDVLTNDDSQSGTPLGDPTVELGPDHGTASVGTDGTVTYTPEDGFSGIDAFSYQICDVSTPDPFCDTAMVTVTVSNVFTDHGPFSTPQNTPLDLQLDDIMTATGAPLDPSVLTSTTPPSHGSVTFGPDSVIYTPNPGYTGPDTFNVRACDTAVPVQCHITIVHVTVGANVVTANDDTDSTTPGTPVITDVVANDETETGTPLDPASVTVTADPGHGTTTVDPATGAITYTPADGWSGTDTYDYRICDTSTPEAVCGTATVTIDVPNQFTDGPAAEGNAGISTPQNTPIDTPLTDIASTSGAPVDPASVTEVTAPEHGSITVDPDTGAVTYTPDPGYSGPDSYVVSVCDLSTPEPQCHDVTVAVTVLPNTVTIDDQSITTRTDTPADPIDVLTTATSASGQPLAEPVVVSAPEHGSATVNADGTITFTPEDGYDGPDEFVVQVCDTGDPVQACDTATISVIVTPVADLATTKTLDTDPVVAGLPVAYTVALTNHGPSTATDVVSIDPIAAAVADPVGTPDDSIAGATCVTRPTTADDLGLLGPDGGPYTLESHPNVVECSYPSIPSGTTVHDAITGTVAATLPSGSALVNQTVAFSDAYDPDLSNNSATVTGTSTAAADLQVTKTADRSTAQIGDRITFTVTVVNDGPSVATGVQIQDAPTGLAPVSAQTSDGTFDSATGTWNVGTLAVGKSSTLTVIATVTSEDAGNVAGVGHSDVADPNPDNDGGDDCTAGETGCGAVFITVQAAATSTPETVTPTSPVTSTVTPTSSAPGADLPNTGFDVLRFAGLALVLLIAGAGVSMLGRRRRSSHR
jgi:uncharacterized repeat protein (TIGR01451 family)